MSSARVVRCWVKSRNERNPYGCLLYTSEGCSEAVKEVFVRLYDKGLIYRGNRMVNWCPHCNTSISDAEVEYEEKDGSFWHLLYPVKELSLIHI